MTESLYIDPGSTIAISKRTKKGRIVMQNNSMCGKAFKIKTTNPNDYTVRPNIGIICPCAKVHIEIQAQEHTLASKDHKFLVEIYQFNWRKDINEFKAFLKSTEQKPDKKLMGVKFVEDDVGSIDNILTPRRVKDYLELFCLLFLLFQFVLLSIKLFR